MSRAFDRMRRITAPWVERPLLRLPVPFAVARQVFELGSLMFGRSLDLRVDWCDLDGVPTRVTLPKGAHGRILWLHGGGFVMGSPGSYAALTDRLALRTGMEVWVPRYRLAPEHPFPAAPDDCARAARALGGEIHIGGDSAGGTLALTVLQALLADGSPPASLTVISPGVDLRPDREIHTHTEMVFSEDVLRRFQRAYVAGADPNDPRVSPLFADYTG
ncbi:MAG: alpha/beta hydrolase fold domain-containing protein, partial [Jannaschia sp.]